MERFRYKVQAVFKRNRHFFLEIQSISEGLLNNKIIKCLSLFCRDLLSLNNLMTFALDYKGPWPVENGNYSSKKKGRHKASYHRPRHNLLAVAVSGRVMEIHTREMEVCFF